jgi:hypothetical protein
MMTNLLTFDLDDAITHYLIRDAQSHCTLVLERGKATHLERRQAIRAEIEHLRVERY